MNIRVLFNPHSSGLISLLAGYESWCDRIPHLFGLLNIFVKIFLCNLIYFTDVAEFLAFK